MRRSLRPLLAAILALFLTILGACGGGADDDDSGDTAAGTTSEAAEGDAEGGAGERAAGGGVQLLDAGKEPRRELRFVLRPGQTFRTRMTMTMGMNMAIDGRAMPSMPLPPMEVLIAGRIDEVEDGVARYSFTYERIGAVRTEGIDPAVASQYDTALQKMHGLQGTGSIDAQGNVGESTVDTSKVTDPTLKSTLDSMTAQISNMTVPFPTEAVGVGARWKADRRTLLNGITTDASHTYTLRSRDGDRYVLDVEQSVTAAPGPVEIPGLGAGRAEIVDYLVENRGEIAGDLTRVLPVSSDISGGGDIEMKVSDGGQTANLFQKLTLQVTFAEA